MYNHVLIGVWIVIQALIGFNLVFPLILYALYKISNKNNHTGKEVNEADYAIIVTAYGQTQSLFAVVDSLLNLHYKKYLIYIVADNCDIRNLHFADNRVVVLRPAQTLSSNTRSHFYAIKNFKRSHDRLTIIDSDNLADPNYLNALNKCFNNGFEAVQGIRKAKNLDTTFACLDAARDIYYHFYDGRLLFGAGSSATLAGSGMAFSVKLYIDCLKHPDITGAGFDKVLQANIVKRGYRIAFTDEAVVYDEKTSQPDQLIKQRSRWINTWFRYFSFGFTIIIKGIKNFNLNQFLFGLVLLRPPLFIFLILSFICLITDFWINEVTSAAWLAGFVFFITGFIIALTHSKTDRRIYNSLAGIPQFMFLQVLSLFKARKANAFSIATTHIHNKTIKELKEGTA